MITRIITLCMLMIHVYGDIHGIIEDCDFNADTLYTSQALDLHRSLQHLRTRPFFKYFKVNLYSLCPFWQDAGMCAKRSCSVCECEQDSIPFPWRVEQTHPVDRSVDSWLTKWDEGNDETWIAQDDSQSMSFVDLSLNPDGYTGFSGAEAHRIWSAIYTENCFNAGAVDDLCREERIFFRLMSGLHTCITVHTANNYWLSSRMSQHSIDDPLTPPTDDSDHLPRDKAEKFQEFVAGNLIKFPDRVQNLYFTYVFLLRAVRKASNVLLSYDYNSGDTQTDRLLAEELREFIENSIVRQCSPRHSFDEESMFTDPRLRQQFRRKFVNISKIMDCVGCEKCRLHGKLQTLGIGTALKILFYRNGGEGPVHSHAIPLLSGGADIRPGDMELTRNEVVALIVTLAKFAHAVELVRTMQRTDEVAEPLASSAAVDTDDHASVAQSPAIIMAAATCVMIWMVITLYRTCAGTRRRRKRE